VIGLVSIGVRLTAGFNTVFKQGRDKGTIFDQASATRLAGLAVRLKSRNLLRRGFGGGDQGTQTFVIGMCKVRRDQNESSVVVDASAPVVLIALRIFARPR
jgi:hypothetical protein